MDLDELERQTHEQLRALQEEFRIRAEPLTKILADIESIRGPKPLILSKEEAEAFGVSLMSDPDYKEAQDQTNKAYRRSLDRVTKTNFSEMSGRQKDWAAEGEKKEARFFQSPFFKKFSGQEPES